MQNTDSYDNYEDNRMKLEGIRKTYKKGFLYTCAVCLITAFLGVFGVRIEVISAAASIFDSIDSFMGRFFGGFTQIASCMILVFLAYLAWANFRKLNIFFLVIYLLIFIFGIKNHSLLSICISPAGIFLYCLSLSAMFDHRELEKEEGYPNFRIPVEELLADKPEEENDQETQEYTPPGIPGLKSDYEDFFKSHK